jgi:hypothetical protein
MGKKKKKKKRRGQKSPHMLLYEIIRIDKWKSKIGCLEIKKLSWKGKRKLEL